jgi:hypothetical protein
MLIYFLDSPSPTIFIHEIQITAEERKKTPDNQGQQNLTRINRAPQAARLLPNTNWEHEICLSGLSLRYPLLAIVRSDDVLSGNSDFVAKAEIMSGKADIV